MPSQIPRFKVSGFGLLFLFYIYINYFHTQEKISHTQELYSAALDLLPSLNLKVGYGLWIFLATKYVNHKSM